MDKIKYRSGYRHQLAANYSVFIGVFGYKIRTEFITLTATGWLTVKRGYAWDGATGLPSTPKSLMRASLVHDALYQLMRNGLFDNRDCADTLFGEIADEDGFEAPGFALWLVQRFGGGFARHYPDKLAVKTAPGAGGGK